MVAAALAGEADAVPRALLPHLQDLYSLYQVLVKARGRRGAIDFETLETRMEFDDQGKITAIHPVARNDAHRLIEECMLAANVCASDILQKHEHPALYRIHEGPKPEKLADLREFLREFGLQLGGGDEPQAKDYAKLLEDIRGRPDYQLLADRAAALAAAGRVQPGERRPLRTGVRGLHALHLADPALSRSARASRHQGGARRTRPTIPAAGRSWASIARRPSGAPTRPRATSRPG